MLIIITISILLTGLVIMAYHYGKFVGIIETNDKIMHIFESRIKDAQDMLEDQIELLKEREEMKSKLTPTQIKYLNNEE